MPELPEVQASSAIAARAGGLRLPASTSPRSGAQDGQSAQHVVGGPDLDEADRRGKFLCLRFGAAGWLVIHLARAGWLRLTDKVPTTAARPGRGPLVARLTFVNDDGEPVLALDLTEAGTRKGAALYVVGDPSEVPGWPRWVRTPARSTAPRSRRG